MSDLSDVSVAVVGGGVLGLSIAAELGRRGAVCTVLDPAVLGDNASGVSAGMIAPAFESALDAVDAGRFALLRAARDLWPAFMEAHGGPPPDSSGALWVGAAGGDAVADALAREGAQFEVASSLQAQALSPGLAAGLQAVFTPEDWRIEPAGVLGALLNAVQRQGGRVLPLPATAVTPGGVSAPGAVVEADAVIVAAGYGSRTFADAIVELRRLHPVKGERLIFPGSPPISGVTVRSSGGYVAPSKAGAIVGATMQVGFDDRSLTPEASTALRKAASELFPHLFRNPAVASAGVRAATPDGLPFVGRSASGLWLATGARRNGWLLAPMVAGLIADGLERRDPGGWAEALRPDR